MTNQLALKGESTKTYKSVEAFLATPPLPCAGRIDEPQAGGKGAYSANAKYDCADDIQFEFSLDCKKSAVFNKEFTPTLPEGRSRSRSLWERPGSRKSPLRIMKSWSTMSCPRRSSRLLS
jgi:hypothetical protein